MRILVISPVLPHLPSHDAARLAPSHLIDQLSERHAVGVIAATFGRTARVLEALALGTPVVATSASLSGLDDVLPGHHVLTAQTDAEFADAVALLLREPVVANTIARNARDLVERRFTWRTVVQRYEALYARLAPARVERAA